MSAEQWPVWDMIALSEAAAAAALVGVDALLRSGDRVAAPTEDDSAGPMRIVRASVERWLVACAARHQPLGPRNAWALIWPAAINSSPRRVGLLERPEELSRTRARLARGAGAGVGENLAGLAPRLRRRVTLMVR